MFAGLRQQFGLFERARRYDRLFKSGAVGVKIGIELHRHGADGPGHDPQTAPDLSRRIGFPVAEMFEQIVREWARASSRPEDHDRTPIRIAGMGRQIPFSTQLDELLGRQKFLERVVKKVDAPRSGVAQQSAPFHNRLPEGLHIGIALAEPSERVLQHAFGLFPVHAGADAACGAGHHMIGKIPHQTAFAFTVQRGPKRVDPFRFQAAQPILLIDQQRAEFVAQAVCAFRQIPFHPVMENAKHGKHHGVAAEPSQRRLAVQARTKLRFLFLQLGPPLLRDDLRHGVVPALDQQSLIRPGEVGNFRMGEAVPRQPIGRHGGRTAGHDEQRAGVLLDQPPDRLRVFRTVEARHLIHAIDHDEGVARVEQSDDPIGRGRTGNVRHGSGERRDGRQAIRAITQTDQERHQIPPMRVLMGRPFRRSHTAQGTSP